MDTQSSALVLIPLFPLLGALAIITICNANKNLHRFSGIVATVFATLSFAITLKLFLELGSDPSMESISLLVWTWFTVSTLSVEFALRFDELAAVMTLIVTGVGSLISFLFNRLYGGR
jgi:NADH:ubiquinone oxidoreductase subunit 5 (subunit L)/multisubunit Na+/H+ antiporter MnhA subunit